MNLPSVQPEQFGLTTEKAQNIYLRFSPKELEFNALIHRYNEVLKMDLDEALNDALALKKDYIAIEKSINEIHKAEKDFYLNGGRFVDAQKNRFIVHITEHKKKLDEIIKYKEFQKKAELQKVIDKRKEELSQYMDSVDHLDLNMSEEVYQAFKSVKIKEYNDAEELKKSNEIIAKIYQSYTFEEFNTELFGSHIEERKKQINASRLLAIANYQSGDLGFELDNEELNNAYNERLVVLDGLRIDRIKNEMQRLYNLAIHEINTNISEFKESIFDAQEFSEEWKWCLNDLALKYQSRREYLSNILIKMPETIIKGDSVYLGDRLICNINQLSEESIKIYNSLLGGQQQYENWINSFSIIEIDDKRYQEVKNKFEAFKKWALNLK